MLSVKVPAFLRPRRSFYRLRSFHLSPEAAAQLRQANPQAPLGGPNSQSLSFRQKVDVATPQRDDEQGKLTPRFVNPLRGSHIVIIAIIVSFLFISTISLAFIGEDVEEPYFKKMLDGVATSSPGLVLIGESVDVDIDEPQITIRWSLLACGDEFVLPASAGAHGSSCGLPSQALKIFVDQKDEPAISYDPEEIPFNRDSGHRRSIQNLVQFDSDHVLDVHEARLYPFDNYVLSSTLRAESSTNQSIPIRQLATIDLTSNFVIETVDVDSYSTLSDNTQQPSRDIDMNVRRPSSARGFTLLLFGVSWVLTHVTVAHVFLARRLKSMRPILKHLVSAGAILIGIPQIRNAMPDAPGFDGVLIDSIGFFPQMIISGLSVIILLLILLVKEIDIVKNHVPGSISFPPPPPSFHQNRSLCRPPPMPTAQSSSMEIKQYDLHRLMKHLQGEYVFPPVKPSHRLKPSKDMDRSHKRSKTMSKIMEAGEVSHWSDSE